MKTIQVNDAFYRESGIDTETGSTQKELLCEEVEGAEKSDDNSHGAQGAVEKAGWRTAMEGRNETQNTKMR